MTFYPFANAGAQTLLATTPAAGFALQNATPTIVTWTAPSDGQLHRATVVMVGHVTSLETGGALNANITLPDGQTVAHSMAAGGSAAGTILGGTSYDVLVEAGTSVSLVQSSALTGGAALVWAQIWGQ